MIKNVNLMQNPIDITWDENSEYSREHLIQALANLGQRIGIKGDSLSYKSFTFNDIISDTTYDASEYIGFIEYVNVDNSYKAKFGVTKKINLTDDTVIDTTVNIANSYIFPSDLTFSIPINNIEKYSRNSICVNENNELTFMLVGKTMGSYEGSENNSNLYYYKFNTLSNKLMYGYKLFHYERGTNDKNYYCVLRIENNKLKNNLTNYYKLKIYLFSSDYLSNNRLKKYFNDIFCFKNYYNTNDIPFSIIKNEYVDIEKLENYVDDELINYDSNSAISVVINNIANSNVFKPIEVDLVYDTNKNELLAIDKTKFSSSVNYLLKEYGINIEEELFMINEDINKLYVNIYKYYNEKFYLESRASLIKRILLKIYERGFNEYNQIYRLYIPLDHYFHYICNSNDEMNLYYSSNIYVTYTSLDDVDLEEFWNYNTNLIYDYNGIDKVKVYNFELSYNKLDDTLINSMDIKDIYTMPYINANNNWSINDTDTKIRAIGKDAGNPNIIIIFNDNKNSYKVLNAISNKKYIEGATYNQKWFTINPALFENIYEIDIKCCAYIPEVTNVNYEYFKDSIIFSISTLDCLEYDEYQENYKGSYIYTLWNIVEKNNKYSFELLNDESNEYALALGSTVNLINANSDDSITNLNDMDLILLKSIVSNVGHERLAINNNNWLILKNKQSEEYVKEFNLGTTDYNNDLNGIIQYNDNIKLVANHIIHTQSSSKYISDLKNISITNSLYPKYEITKSEENVTNNNVTIIQNLKKISSTRESKVISNGKVITNIESLIEKLKDVKVEEIVDNPYSVTIESAKLISSKYNEYVFNSNVPTIDYKEVFNRNVNVLNRLNVISVDSNGQLYNSYIGTSFNDSNKSTLHIGTTETNINIGSDTLINEIDRNKFITHNSISIDFNDINLNAKNNIIASKPILQSYSKDGQQYNMTSIKLIGGCVPFIFENGKVSNITNIKSSMFIRENNSNNDIYLSLSYIMNTYFKISLENYSYISIRSKHYDNNNSEYIHKIESINDRTKFIYAYKMNDYYNEDNNCLLHINDNTYYFNDTFEIMYYEYYTTEYMIDETNINKPSIAIYINL